MNKLPVFPVLGTVGHVSLDGTASDVALSDEFLDQHLDAILRGAGSALKYYTLQKNIDEMREALRAAIEAAMKGGAA
jgi:predicted methyltransferase MtxX (methanogen marker protein 4)